MPNHHLLAALREPVPATGALYPWTPTTDLRHRVATALPGAPYSRRRTTPTDAARTSEG